MGTAIDEAFAAPLSKRRPVEETILIVGAGTMGAGIAQIIPNLLYLGVTTLIFLTFGAWSFRWRIE